jgi:hypothetical protein
MSVLLLALIIIVLPKRLQVLLLYHYHICLEAQKQEVRPADTPGWPSRKIIKNLAADGQAGYVFQPFAWLRTNHVSKEQLWT